MVNVYSVTYVSSATQPLTTLQLRELLSECNEHNLRDAITGMLLYKDGNFMQVLEGEEASVRAAYARIEKDPRHRGMINLLHGPVPERQFSNWSMGFRDLSEPPTGIPGYSPFLNTPLSSAEFVDNPSNAHGLLMLFKQRMTG